MQAEKSAPISQEILSTLMLNDYICMDDFFTDRKTKLDKK